MIKNILLFIVSIVLLGIFTTIGIIAAIVKIVVKGASTSYFIETALAVDILGNTLGQHLWNSIFIKDEGYCFGKLGETMSSVLGKNQRDNTLRRLGKLLVSILDTLETNHCLIAITA